MSNLAIGSSTYNPFLPVTSTQNGSSGNSSTSTSASGTTAADPNARSSDGTPVSLLIDNANKTSTGATGALLAGTSTVSVLGASLGDDGTSIFGSMPSQNSAILNQIIQTATKRYSDMQQVITDNAAQRTAEIDSQNQGWISTKAEINNAAAAVSSGQDSISRVSDDLLTIRGFVDEAGTKGEDISYWAGQFDDMINTISNEADSGGTTSLVGNINRVDYTGNQIEYRNNPSLTTSTVTGTYIATDYRITADDGTVWQPDPGSDTITHYKALQGEAMDYETGGVTLTDSTSTRTGIKLDSYDASTGKITVDITVNPDEPPRTVTGTLQKTGIGLMPSWFYDGMTTAAGRQRAYNDLNAAQVNLTSASSQLQLAANQVNTDSQRTDAALNDLTKQTVKVNQDELQQQQDLQAKSSQEISALQANLTQLQDTQSNYLNLLGGAVDDPFGQSILSIEA